MAIPMSRTFQQQGPNDPVPGEIQDLILRRGGSSELARRVLESNRLEYETANANTRLRRANQELTQQIAEAEENAYRYRAALQEIVAMTYDSWSNGAIAKSIAEGALRWGKK